MLSVITSFRWRMAAKMRRKTCKLFAKPAMPKNLPLKIGGAGCGATVGAAA